MLLRSGRRPADVHRRAAPRRSLHLVAGLAVSLGLLGAACSDDSSATGDSGPGADDVVSGEATISVLSTRADMVTGGDVLLAVPSGDDTTVTVGGEEVDAEAKRDADGTSHILVTGLPEGTSTIAVEVDGREGEVEVTNHPLSGPVFSGEQLPMTVCTSERFGLAASTPPNCDAEPVVRLAFVDAEGTPRYVQAAAEVPEDAATVEVDGESRRAILRVETGVIDRGVYTITTLANGSAGPGDPADPNGDWDVDHWNGRLVYRFGGGCGTTFGQGFQMLGTPDLALLADGYAFATNTLNTFQVQCQDILSAEAAMMTKEHFIEAYGVPEVTIGDGGSGGAIQQLLIAQNYPGILDAIGPSLVFPDAASIAPGVVDCALLSRFYASPGGAGFTPEQRTAVNGHISGLTCLLWEQTFVPVVDPTQCGFGSLVGGAATALPGLEGGLPTVPEGRVYDPETNPDGIRCTFQDSYPSIFEEDSDTGFAERPVDNVGVQYGLKAFNSGILDFDRFIALNEGIGGLDIDANPVPERMEASEGSLERLYRTGRVVEGGPLLDIPVIATNVYTDDQGDIHDRIRMFSLDARLRDADGEQAPGFVMWTRPSPPEGDLTEQLSGALDVSSSVVRLLDEWATALEAEGDDDTAAERLEATRPDDAVNTCFDVGGAVVDSGPEVYDSSGPCTDPYPVGDDPRTASGAPLRNDIGKCRLQSVDEAVEAGVYEVDLTEDQVARIRSVFPGGVCDWTVPGVGQVDLGEPWQVFD